MWALTLIPAAAMLVSVVRDEWRQNPRPIRKIA